MCLIENKFANRKLEKKVGGKSAPRALISIYIESTHAFDVNIRLYEYWQEQVKIRKKRWNNKEIKKFYWK
jgi:hypothetical protein